MRIAEFIREMVLRPRIKQSGCLVVYDSAQRYRQLCQDLASDKIVFIDASESGIESREIALKTLCELGRPQVKLEGMLIYVPTARPETDEQKQLDPFALYVECGTVFPQDDGDEYLSLCLRAKPDQATEIRRVFNASPDGPSFVVIDAIGGGNGWPVLRAILKVESARELLFALLAPNDEQLKALKEEENWNTEARDFLFSTLSMEVKTRGKTWSLLSDELWRYVLFGEFAFGRQELLPDALKNVPRPPIEAQHIIEDVCNQLRNDPRARTCYMERAENVEIELGLALHFSTNLKMGARDTFPFEERLFLQEAVKALSKADTDTTRKIMDNRKESVWFTKGESQAEWDLVRAGLSLVESCEDLERQLPSHVRSMTDLIDFYISNLREADRLHREFEQAASDLLVSQGVLLSLIKFIRSKYSSITEKVQAAFTKHVENSGWPPTGRLSNCDVFDRFVGEALKEKGQRVAYLMVDALRYELGVELQKLLSEDASVMLYASYAQVPSTTKVGMASLLPAARTDLVFTVKDDYIIPMLADKPVENVSQRMETFRSRYGDRFYELPLNSFIRNKTKISENVDLLVIRSTEIDSLLENNPETTLGLILSTLKQIRVALDRLKTLGFKEAIIVADHGFFLNVHAEAGDVCMKPEGTWYVNEHNRMLLGEGAGTVHSVVIPAEKLGIKGVSLQASFPRSMAPFKAGQLYLHGGVSLPEIIVPVLVVRLDAKENKRQSEVVVQLSYKNGAKHITTRRPVIDVLLPLGDLFAQEKEIEILLEAQDSKGNVVGEALTGGIVNPATRTITLMPGQKQQVILKMDASFEGKFTVKALNPTNLVGYCSLNLETEYAV